MASTQLVTLLLLLLNLGVFSAPENHPEPLSVFKDPSTFYKIHNPINDRLVSSFETSDSRVSDEVLNRQESYENFDDLHVNEIYTRVTLPEMDSNDLESAPESTGEREQESSLMSHIPSTLQMIFSWKAILTDLIDTVHKATRIYQAQKEELRPEVNETSPRSAQFSSLPSALLDLVLSPRALDELIAVGRAAQSEDDALRGLTSVVLKSEGRGGSSLTLDPVTVIALLTLAAYLIRAVYQILITNNNGRSFDPDQPFMLNTINLPENMVWIIDAITGSDYDDTSAAARPTRALDDVPRDNGLDRSPSGVLSVPGSVAAITKLRREGHSDCINLYTVSIGAYLGDVKLWPLLSSGAPVDEELTSDRCGEYKGLCQPTTLREARQLRDMFTEASSKLLRLLSSAREARRRSYARRSAARSQAHT